MKAAVILVFWCLGIQQPGLYAQMKEGNTPLSLSDGEQESSVWKNYDEIHPMNIVFIEAAGSGIIGSVNYERMITNSVGVRIGYGAGIPLLVNYYVGGTYRFEIGVGVTHVPRISEWLDLGPEGTTLLTMTPLYSTSMNKLKVWGGVSIGYAF